MSPPALVLPPDMSESAWQACVLRLVALYGWRSYHTHDSRRSDPGWPDLVLAHPARRRLLVWELKTNRGRTRADQRAWLSLLASAGVEVAVVRPRDLPAVVNALGPKNLPIPRADKDDYR